MTWIGALEWIGQLGTSAPLATAPPISGVERLCRNVVVLAIDEIGKGETEGNNRGPDIRRYLRGMVDSKGRQLADGREWCAAFASYPFVVASEALGVPMLFERHTGAKRLCRHVGAVGRLFSDPDEAGPGDLISWHRDVEGSWKGHVEIVEYVQDGLVHTIAGNSGAAGRARVRRLVHDIRRERFYTFASLRPSPSVHRGPLVAA